MPPRKKLKASPASLSSTGRKSKQKPSNENINNNNNNNKYYGIEHFFERHSSTPQPPPHTAATTATTSSGSSRSNCCYSGNNRPQQEEEQEVGPSNCPDSPPPPPPTAAPLLPNPTATADNSPLQWNLPRHPGGGGEVSPQVMSSSKSSSLIGQRFSFSPSMLIKQSQDVDGAVDEVTWKISPVNHRLNNTLLPIRPCSLKVKVKDLNQVKPFHSSILLHPPSALSSSLSTQHHPPFTTPPSLSFSHQRIATVQENGASDQSGLEHHKKALIELLDQVGDALSCEDSQTSEIKTYSLNVQETNSYEMPRTANLVAERAPQEGVRPLSSQNFLVLEVSEKHQHATSSGAQCPYKLLRLLDEESGEERSVYLWEEWYYTVISPGDTVNVIGKFDEQGRCDVDHDNNLLIVHPDLLISGTRVAASFSCSRRAVLDERLKCNENSTAALIGTLLHQIFQAGLVKENPTIKFLEEIAEVALQRNIESLYACGVHEKNAMKTLVDAVPKIMNWITILKSAPESEEPTVDFGCEFGLKKLRIVEVIDIEEMAWAPKYGLKGMIDASVRVKIDPSTGELDEKIVPLEFKTGKVPSGQPTMEHSAQVILYTLLMSERYLKNIDSGLLCYLHSDHTQGIAVRRSDVVGLIMRRNELASDILKASMTQQLPPMLRSPSMCRGCRHLDSCTIYHKVHGGSMESSGLGELFDSHVQHLTSVHCAFFQHWDRLIDLEAKEAQLTKSLIWRSRSLNSYQSASCSSSFLLDTSTGFLHQRSPKDNCYIYRFVRRKLPSHILSVSDGNSHDAPLPSIIEMEYTLKTGDYVIISTESGQQNVASGVVTDVNHSHVSVSISKRLRLPGSGSLLESNKLLGEIWRIDKDEAMTSFSVMRTNLVQLALPTSQSSHIRKMIVDLEAPRFDSGCIFSQDPAISYIWSVKTLNADQRRSILKILTAKDYALILGMPGTGKTSTMVHAVRALLIRGASILLTSYTNSAVDNLLIKLKAEGIDFLRIGRHEAIREEIWEHCFSALGDQSVEDIRSKLEKVRVVAVTCLGVANPLLASKKFDVCIMDEAGQITLPISLAPLMHASVFVLVGDHYQLPPLVQSTEARENGMAVSLFCRLSEAHPQAVSPLQSQYRMCQGIMKLSNALIYGDRLRCGSSEIANSKLTYSSSDFSSSWLKEVLNPSKMVIFINTDMLPAFEARESKTVNNPMEAFVIAEIAQELITNGIEGEDIGIITPYNSQADLIRTALCVPSIEIHTIDKYQGRDKDCILVSFVRSSETPRNCVSSLLGDWHRINVALTRAKKKLIMVGSCKTLSKVPLLKLLIKEVEEQLGVFNMSKDDLTSNKGKGLSRLKKCSQLR